MQRSAQRILTTHVGSLARPDTLIPLLRLKERGQPYDQDTFAQLVREAVAEVVRKQVEAGIDIVTDGEQGKESFFGYINDRFNGFELRPVPAEAEANPRVAGREYLAFPDYYAWSERSWGHQPYHEPGGTPGAHCRAYCAIYQTGRPRERDRWCRLRLCRLCRAV